MVEVFKDHEPAHKAEIDKAIAILQQHAAEDVGELQENDSV